MGANRTSKTAEIVIVGAGVAGAAMAIVLVRRGHSVLMLDKSKVHLDKVRGESITPWGVEEARQLGVLDILLAAGGHFARQLVVYGEGVDPAAARSRAIDLSALVPGVGGNLKIGHPPMCEALDEAAIAAGARLLRGISRLKVTSGTPPAIEFVHDGETHALRPRLVIGAGGRGSVVAKQMGADVRSDPLHHLFGGLLVSDCPEWPDTQMAIGTEGQGTFYVFPQGRGCIRLYYAYDAERKREFAGLDGVANFPASFRLGCVPGSEAVAAAKPAGPYHAYPNSDTWIDRPMAPGVVLVGDAAGHNDPTIGQGVSIAFRDVRLVAEALAGHDDWTPEIFAPYAEERRERMRRPRTTAQQFSKYRCEFSDEAKAGRTRARDRLAVDPSLAVPFLVPLKGPDRLPLEAYEPSTWSRLFG
jgi:2-polyprenyl-6-methoxyphenol hydroxylase-like FAD-dependent oxidoreductase